MTSSVEKKNEINSWHFVQKKYIEDHVIFQKEKKIKNYHGFNDNSEVSLPISQGYITSTLCQMSNSLQVGPSRLGELRVMGYRKNNGGVRN